MTFDYFWSLLEYDTITNHTSFRCFRYNLQRIRTVSNAYI